LGWLAFCGGVEGGEILGVGLAEGYGDSLRLESGWKQAGKRLAVFS
jgi:hypothetical protein